MQLVSAMQRDYPELIVERIYDLFTWTVWMSKNASVVLRSTLVEDSNIPMNTDTPSVVVCEGGAPSASNEIATVESERGWDPLLCRSDCSSARLREPSDVASAEDLEYNVVRNSSPPLILMSDSDEDRQDEVIPKVDCKGDADELDIIFPKLSAADVNDFDFL